MAIIAPDVRNIDLAQGRGSSIRPGDTYARPQVNPSAGSDLEQLGKAMQALGVNTMDIGEQRARLQEQQDRVNHEYYAGEVKSELKAGVPVEVQTGQRHPDLSATVRGLVNQKLGKDQAIEDALGLSEKIMSDPFLVGDPNAPEKFTEMLDKAASEARTKYAGQPSYGAGYISQFDGAVQSIKANFARARSEFMQKQQVEEFQRTGIQRAAGAYRGAQVQWDTAEKIADKLPNVAAIAKAGGKPMDSVLTLRADYAERLESMLASMPPELRSQVELNSGFRSTQRQTQLWEDKVGSLMKGGMSRGDAENAARKWVARPGGSNHEHGEAADIKAKGTAAKDFHNTEAGKWIHANAAQHGLYFPMKHEPWHIEMKGGRREGPAAPRRPGSDSDGEDNFDPVEWMVARIVGNPSVEGYGKNTRSSANGIGQFVDGTWLSEFRTQFPEEARGKTNEQILALKTNPEYSVPLTRGFTQRNKGRLEEAGLDVTPTNLYLMHFAGSGAGPKVIKASDGTRIEAVMGADQLEANPHLRGKTVGQVREWAAGKAGDASSGAGAGQNALRSTDSEFARVSGLDNPMRRDAMAKGILDFAMKTRDPRFLDNMPPEYMTPQIQAEFIDARRKILDASIAERSRDASEQARARSEAEREAMVEVTEMAAAGKYRDIDPAKYASMPSVFKYANETLSKGTAIPEGDSQYSAAQLDAVISDAYYRGDFAAVSPSWAGKVPSKTELQDYIYRRPDMRPEEKQALYKGLEKSSAIANLSTDRVVERQWDISLDPIAKAYDVNFQEKIDREFGAGGFSYAASMKSYFDKNIYDNLAAIVKDNGRAPTEAEKLAVAEKVTKQTLDYAKTLKEARSGPSTAAGSTTAKPAEQAPAPAVGATGVQTRVEADGSITILPPAAAPAPGQAQAATPVQSPAMPQLVEPTGPAAQDIPQGDQPYPLGVPPELIPPSLMEKPMIKWTAEDYGKLSDNVVGGVSSFIETIANLGPDRSNEPERKGIATPAPAAPAPAQGTVKDEPKTGLSSTWESMKKDVRALLGTNKGTDTNVQQMESAPEYKQLVEAWQKAPSGTEKVKAYAALLKFKDEFMR